MRILNLLFILALAMGTTGCATALTAISVAGYAKTAYDYQDVILPDERISYSEVNRADRSVENRIMQRFEDEGILPNACIEANAITGHVFLVGAFESKEDALRARTIAKRTQGVQRLTCSFFLTDPSKADCQDSRDLAKSIRTQLADAPTPLPTVRVSVLESNAVLMGFVPSAEDKQAVESLAWNTEGVQDVRSYLSVREQEKQIVQQ